MEEDTDFIDVLVAAVFALAGAISVAAALMTSGADMGMGPGAVLFSGLVLVAGVVYLYIAWGIYTRKREAWGVGIAVTAFVLAWGAVSMVLSRMILSTGDLLNYLLMIGLLAYLVLRRRRFGVGRVVAAASPTKSGPTG